MPFPSAELAHELTIRVVSVKTLRQWCTPGVILVITSLSDELMLLPHAIRQARQSGAKIVLVHSILTAAVAPGGRRSLVHRSAPQAHEARTILERMARQLRWLGIECEPVILTGPPEVEIPSIVRSCAADRVVIGFGDDPNLAKARLSSVAEQILANIDVPTCVIGRNVSLASPSSRLTRNVTLAVSLESGCDIPLSFASRLAQEQRAKLTILHVFGRTERDLPQSARTPVAVASRLPAPIWREAQLFCTAEIEVREGNPVEEILKHATSTSQDLVLLCSPGISPGQAWRSSASYRVLAEAECPVFVLQKQLGSEGHVDAPALNTEKVPAYGEGIPIEVRKQEVV